jgi:hypothetical protein
MILIYESAPKVTVIAIYLGNPGIDFTGSPNRISLGVVNTDLTKYG